MSQIDTTDRSEQAISNQRNLRRLILSIQASIHKLNLLIAVCDNPRYRNELIHTYEAELQAKGVTCYQVRLDRQQPSLKQSLLDWQAKLVGQEGNSSSAIPRIVTVLGGDELLGVRLQEDKSAQERFFFSVQWTREGLREFQVPIVLWVTQAIAQGLAQQAPDFWSWRGGVFEFVQPIAETMLQVTQGIKTNIQADLTEISALADPTSLEQQIVALQSEDPNSPLLESLYQSLGETYFQRLKKGLAADRSQEEAKAIAAFQSAIARRKILADLTPLATSLNELASLYYSQGRYAEAEPLYLQALSIREQTLGHDHPDGATSLNNLALLYKSQGRYAEAEPLYLQALSIREQTLGYNHPDVANSLNNLANLYKSQGRYAKAEPLLVQALSIREQTLGHDHPDVATSFNNLASLYDLQGRYAEAEPLYVRALAISEQQLGGKHPTTMTFRQNLEGLQQAMS